MRAHGDPDLLLVEEMLAPPSADDARSSLEYWERRRAALPVYRRAARREARDMAARWQDRLLAAEQARADFRLKGCFQMGEHCRCIGEDDQPVHLQAETCRIVASEPRVFQQ